MRPGITGWAQVNGRNSLSWPERIELDLWYLEHRSLALDLRILAGTVRSLLRPTGVTGEGGVNPDYPSQLPSTSVRHPASRRSRADERVGSVPRNPVPLSVEGTVVHTSRHHGT